MQIENFEKELNLILPDEIKQFYKFSNGFESAEDIFRIIDFEEITSSFAEF
ncbi:SMI1/KNR4 family protein [Mucilaginibacter sp.]